MDTVEIVILIKTTLTRRGSGTNKDDPIRIITEYWTCEGEKIFEIDPFCKVILNEKGISKKLRFEVFKRDGFRCAYCGKKTPEVVLEVDHIVSIKDGGQDDISNLTTSCFDCNRGKGKISLDEIPTQEEDLHEKTILLLERERQIREYNEVLEQIREREDKDLKELAEFWSKYFYYSFFKKSSIRQYLKVLSKEQIKDGIEIVSEKKIDGSYEESFKYLCGILNNWRKQEEI